MPRGLRRGCLRPGGLSVGIGWDNPELTEQCRYDACVVVPDGTALDPADPSDQGIGLQTVEGGLYACYRRMVGRAQFSEALNELFGIWLPHSGYECVGAPPGNISQYSGRRRRAERDAGREPVRAGALSERLTDRPAA